MFPRVTPTDVCYILKPKSLRYQHEFSKTLIFTEYSDFITGDKYD